MPRFSLIALSFLALSMPALADPGTREAKWAAGIFGRSTDDSLSTSKEAGGSFVVDLNWAFNDSVLTHFRGGTILSAGSSSALFTDEFRPGSILFLTEAKLQWNVYKPFFLTAGAVNQTAIATPLLFSGNTFPSAIAEFKWDIGEWRINAFSQAAIPTGSGLSTRSTGKEEAPLVYTQTAQFTWGKDKENWNSEFLSKVMAAQAAIRITHFDFRNLTHGMAQDSRFYGNSVRGVAAGSTFIYEYEGWEIGPKATIPLTENFSFNLGASWVKNSLGPAASNQGQYAFAGFIVKGSNFAVRPVAEYYKNEADSSPAFYTSKDFGHNNRRGFGGMLTVDLYNPAIKINLRIRNSELITAQPFQRNNFQYYELVVGLPYEKI